jgi:hypothetical protein
MHTAHPINLQHALLNAQGFLISFLFGTEPSSTKNKAIERLLRTNHSCQAAEMKGDTPVDGAAACGIEGGGAAASKSRTAVCSYYTTTPLTLVSWAFETDLPQKCSTNIV